MKRIICILLTILILLSTSSCKNKKDQLRDPINFYYRTTEIHYGTEKDVITSEQRERFGHEEDYEYLVNMYLDGPTSGTCISPFPAGTTLVQLDLVKNKVIIVLSSHISLLSGAELTIACTCLARTLHEMTGMKSVQISSDGDLLDGKESIIIHKDSFVTKDTHIPTQPLS